MILLINLLPAADVLPSEEPLAGPLQAFWLRALADGISALSCLVILAAVIVFLRRRRDLGPVTRGLGALLVAFLAAGFLTHLMLAVTLWLPAYSIQGGVAVATAAISLSAAVAVWPQLPKAIDLPTPGDLVRSNDALTRSNASLLTTIAARTHELEQGNQRFELALSRSNITVFSQDQELRYTWIHNPREGLTPASVDDAGAEAASFADMPEVADMKRRVLATGETSSRGVGFADGTEDELYFDLTISPTLGPDGTVDGVLGTAVDLTERRRFERRLNTLAMQAAGAYRRIELALEDSPITVFEQDADLRYTFVQNPPPGTTVEDFLGHTDFEMFATSGGATVGLRQVRRAEGRRAQVDRGRTRPRRHEPLLHRAARAEDRVVGDGRRHHRHGGRPDRAPPRRAAHAAGHARTDASVEEHAGGGAGHGAQDREH